MILFPPSENNMAAKVLKICKLKYRLALFDVALIRRFGLGCLLREAGRMEFPRVFLEDKILI